MATKNSSLRANKQVKRQKRAKQKQAAIRKEQAVTKQMLGRKAMEKELFGNVSDNDILQQAHRRLKQLKKKARQGKISQKEFEEQIAGHEEITNTVVMQNINDVIPALIRVHSGVEVFSRLAAEKRFEVTAEENTLINTLDEQVVHITEDISAIVSFVEDKKEPDDYMAIFMHYTELLARCFEVTMPALMLMLDAKKPEIDAYADEHRNKELPVFEYMRGLHEERMRVVVPIYRTRTSPIEGIVEEAKHSYTPENPMPSDPIIDSDVAEAVLAETPNLEQDVLAGDSEHPLSSDVVSNV
jgi:hypothetical protein